MISRLTAVQIMRVYLSRPSSLHDEGELIKWRTDGMPTVLRSKAGEVYQDEAQLLDLFRIIQENTNPDAPAQMLS